MEKFNRYNKKNEVVCLDCYAHNISQDHICDPMMKGLVKLKNSRPSDKIEIETEDGSYLTEDWEARFDKSNFIKVDLKNNFITTDIPGIKSFIKNLLESEREKSKFWEEEAKRFSQNADFWRDRS